MVGVRDNTMRSFQEIYENGHAQKYLTEQLRRDIKNILGNYPNRKQNVNFVNRPKNLVNRIAKRVSSESKRLNKFVNKSRPNNLNLRNYANYLMRLNRNLKNLQTIRKVQSMRKSYATNKRYRPGGPGANLAIARLYATRRPYLSQLLNRRNVS